MSRQDWLDGKVSRDEHVMRCYRVHILACKRKWRTARGLIHYRKFVDAYLEAKRNLHRARLHETGSCP